MGFTFVTSCLPCLRLLSTPPHGNAVTGHSPLNDVIGGDVVFIRGLWFSGARQLTVLLGTPIPNWLFVSQCDDRVDPGSASRRDDAGKECHDHQDADHRSHRDRIVFLYIEQHVG